MSSRELTGFVHENENDEDFDVQVRNCTGGRDNIFSQATSV